MNLAHLTPAQKKHLAIFGGGAALLLLLILSRQRSKANAATDTAVTAAQDPYATAVPVNPGATAPASYGGADTSSLADYTSTLSGNFSTLQTTLDQLTTADQAIADQLGGLAATTAAAAAAGAASVHTTTPTTTPTKHKAAPQKPRKATVKKAVAHKRTPSTRPRKHRTAPAHKRRSHH